MVTGEDTRCHAGDAVLLCTSSSAMSFISPRTPKARCDDLRAYKRGALFANPCYTQIHPTCIPVAGEYNQSKLTLMSEESRLRDRAIAQYGSRV